MNLAVKKFFFLKNFFRQESAVKNFEIFFEIFFNEFGCKNFFQHISKNGLRMAIRGLGKLLEKSYFLRIVLESL